MRYPTSILVLSIAVTVVAGAEVRTSRRTDGMIEISNVGSGQAATRNRPVQHVESQELRRAISRFSDRQRLDPRLVRALIQVESGFDSKAVSHKGAIGLMQLMPQTALEFGVRDSFDVTENLSGGTRYLRSMIDRFGGSLELALAGYNAGPAAVERYGGVPPYDETTEYVRKVLDIYRQKGGGSNYHATSSAMSGLPVRVDSSSDRILLITTDPATRRAR